MTQWPDSLWWVPICQQKKHQCGICQACDTIEIQHDKQQPTCGSTITTCQCSQLWRGPDIHCWNTEMEHILSTRLVTVNTGVPQCSYFYQQGLYLYTTSLFVKHRQYIQHSLRKNIFRPCPDPFNSKQEQLNSNQFQCLFEIQDIDCDKNKKWTDSFFHCDTK